MVTLLSTTSSPLVSAIVPVGDAKLIVSPSEAVASAWRSEPAPLSFVLVTVHVVAWTLCKLATTAQSSVKRNRIGLLRGKVGFFIGLFCGFIPLQKKKIRSVSEKMKNLYCGRNHGSAFAKATA